MRKPEMHVFVFVSAPYLSQRYRSELVTDCAVHERAFTYPSVRLAWTGIEDVKAWV